MESISPQISDIRLDALSVQKEVKAHAIENMLAIVERWQEERESTPDEKRRRYLDRDLAEAVFEVILSEYDVQQPLAELYHLLRSIGGETPKTGGTTIHEVLMSIPLEETSIVSALRDCTGPVPCQGLLQMAHFEESPPDFLAIALNEGLFDGIKPLEDALALYERLYSQRPNSTPCWSTALDRLIQRYLKGQSSWENVRLLDHLSDNTARYTTLRDLIQKIAQRVPPAFLLEYVNIGCCLGRVTEICGQLKARIDALPEAEQVMVLDRVMRTKAQEAKWAKDQLLERVKESQTTRASFLNYLNGEETVLDHYHDFLLIVWSENPALTGRLLSRAMRDPLQAEATWRLLRALPEGVGKEVPLDIAGLQLRSCHHRFLNRFQGQASVAKVPESFC